MRGPRPPTFDAAYDKGCNNFDFIRFALAAMVLVSHCYALSGRGASEPLFVLSGRVTGGRLAVDSFFVLSGFLVVQSWLGSRDWVVYATKRALRILPALLLVLAFDAFVIGPLATAGSAAAYFASRAPWHHFLSLVLHEYSATGDAFPRNPFPHYLNGSLWSLRYEMLCYVLVALLGLWRGAWRLGVAVLFLLSWSYALLGRNDFATPTLAARLLACFSAGMCYYAFRTAVPYHAGVAVAAATVLVVALLRGGFGGVFPVAGGYLLLAAGFSRRLPLQGFGRPGDFSYGLYLFAFPVQQMIVQALGARVHFGFFVAAAFLTTLGLAIVSWHVVEAPALVLKDRLTG